MISPPWKKFKYSTPPPRDDADITMITSQQCYCLLTKQGRAMEEDEQPTPLSTKIILDAHPLINFHTNQLLTRSMRTKISNYVTYHFDKSENSYQMPTKELPQHATIYHRKNWVMVIHRGRVLGYDRDSRQPCFLFESPLPLKEISIVEDGENEHMICKLFSGELTLIDLSNPTCKCTWEHVVDSIAFAYRRSTKELYNVSCNAISVLDFNTGKRKYQLDIHVDSTITSIGFDQYDTLHVLEHNGVVTKYHGTCFEKREVMCSSIHENDPTICARKLNLNNNSPFYYILTSYLMHIIEKSTNREVARISTSSIRVLLDTNNQTMFYCETNSSHSLIHEMNVTIDKHLVSAPVENQVLETISKLGGNLPSSYSLLNNCPHELSYFNHIRWLPCISYQYNLAIENIEPATASTTTKENNLGWSDPFIFKSVCNSSNFTFIPHAEQIIGHERYSLGKAIFITTTFVNEEPYCKFNTINIYKYGRLVCRCSLSEFFSNLRPIFTAQSCELLLPSSNADNIIEMNIVEIQKELMKKGIIDRITRNIKKDTLVFSYRDLTSISDKSFFDIFSVIDPKYKKTMVTIDDGLYRISDLIALACSHNLTHLIEQFIPGDLMI